MTFMLNNRLEQLQQGSGCLAQWTLKKTNLLFIEDTGLLEGVLGLGYIPHPDCPIVATGGQKAFLAAPTTCDDLTQAEKD